MNNIILKSFKELAKAQLSKQGPPRPGLVPQSGDPQHPRRWVRPQQIERPGEASSPAGWPEPPGATRGESRKFGVQAPKQRSVETLSREFAQQFKDELGADVGDLKYRDIKQYVDEAEDTRHLDSFQRAALAQQTLKRLRRAT